MIPVAVKEFDQTPCEIQAHIRAGGENNSRIALHEVATGQRVTTVAQQRKLIEEGALPARTGQGGFKQNPANHKDPGQIARNYTYVPGYPDVKSWGKIQGKVVRQIFALVGKIVNLELRVARRSSAFSGQSG